LIVNAIGREGGGTGDGGTDDECVVLGVSMGRHTPPDLLGRCRNCGKRVETPIERLKEITDGLIWPPIGGAPTLD
jgi:hypothetical protein